MHRSGGGDGEHAGIVRGELSSLKSLLSSEAMLRVMTEPIGAQLRQERQREEVSRYFMNQATVARNMRVKTTNRRENGRVGWEGTKQNGVTIGEERSGAKACTGPSTCFFRQRLVQHPVLA